MAYSLGDVYRPLRTVMRMNGVVIGWGAGLSLLLLRKQTLVNLGLFDGNLLETGIVWPIRLAGAVLVALGVLFVWGANSRTIETPTLLTMSIAHGLMALVIFTSYLQGEFAGLGGLGRVGLVILFLLCLIGTLTPLRYFQAEFRP